MFINVLKSIGAVLAGFIAVFILSVGIDAVLEKPGVFPPQKNPAAYVWWMLLLALVYRSIYTVAGGFITAALAPNWPMIHAIILGVIGLIFALLGLIVNWSKTGPSSLWYPLLLVILALPCVWLGGKLKIGKTVP
jgi:multisubunit Na+/H+ antiporter MnhB subunit